MDFFNTIFKRVASLPIQNYDNCKNDVISFFNNDSLFQLSIAIASSTLYKDAKKNKSDKIKISLEKYLNRAHFKSIPFGTFSSVGKLSWSKKTEIVKSSEIELNVGFDNLLLTTIIKNATDLEILEFEYIINPSIHFLIKTKICFYKFTILKNSSGENFDMDYVEIDYDENVSWLTKRFVKRQKLLNVIDELVYNGFDRNEASSFLLSLIDIGFLINEFLFLPYNNKLYSNKFNLSDTLVKNSPHIINELTVSNFTNLFLEEQNLILKNNENKNTYALFSVDKSFSTLDQDIKEKIKRYIDFNINYNQNNNIINKKLSEFGSLLYKNYGEGFHALTKIFNPYSGLNYGNLQIDFTPKMHDTILQCILSESRNDVFLNLPNIKEHEFPLNKTPLTFSVMFEVLICKNSKKEILYLKNVGGTTSLMLLNRFGVESEKLCDEIASYEKSVFKNEILAEVNMIPNARSLNVLPYKQYYDFTIPLNAASSKHSNPIFLSEIYLHSKNNGFTLHSKKFNKRIIPKITSAVNIKNSHLDVYRFLGELCYQNEEFYSINFDFNRYSNLFIPYVPRIYLEKDVLLYGAQILLIYKNDTLQEFSIKLLHKIQLYSFGNKFNFQDAKGGIIIDINNENHIIMVYEKLKIDSFLYISEYLYASFVPALKNESGNFVHEFVASVKNTNYKKDHIQYHYSEGELNLVKNPPLNSDWLYLEIYCNSYADSEILKFIQREIILKNKCDLFFFVNYSNPDRHLRLRFKTKSTHNKKYIIKQIQDLQSNLYISKYLIVPYEQETYRYGGGAMMSLSETIFDLDSRDFLTNVIEKDLNEPDVQMFAILKITNYLRFLNFTLDEAIIHCEKCIENFSKEFELTTILRKNFNKEYAEIKNDIIKNEYESFLKDKELKILYHNQIKIITTTISESLWLLIHMSINRHFSENQRFNEFKTYFLTKSYLNQLKFTNKSF